MLHLKEAIVVEGRYDKITLEPLVDTVIFTTEGFGIFRDQKRMELLRRVSERRGLIILTDADGAGLVIRNRLRGCLVDANLKHAYIPSMAGKERRKKTPSREGMLGVEGMSREILEEALRRAGACFENGEGRRPLTKTDLYALGLSGGVNAASRRRQLQKRLGLPENLSANALLDAVNCLYTREEFSAAVESLQEKGGEVSHQDEPCGI